MFSHFGKLALKIGLALGQEVVKAKAQSKDLTADRRSAIANEGLYSATVEIEAKYRAQLVSADQYPDGDIPKILHEPKKDETATSSAKEAIPVAKAIPVAGLIDDADGSGFEARVSITEEIIMKRLGSQTLPTEVWLSTLKWLPEAVEHPEVVKNKTPKTCGLC